MKYYPLKKMMDLLCPLFTFTLLFIATVSTKANNNLSPEINLSSEFSNQPTVSIFPSNEGDYSLIESDVKHVKQMQIENWNSCYPRKPSPSPSTA